jgi:hypothetical protein
MRVAVILALLSLPCSVGAQALQTREDLFVARDAAFAARSASQAQLDAIRARADGFTGEIGRYQAALAQAQSYCSASFEDRNAYDRRMEECQQRRRELDAWRARLAAGPDALIAEAGPIQARVDAASARIADLDRTILALGPSTEFEREMSEARRLHQEQLLSLRSDIGRIVVPPPQQRVVHEGVILGMMNGPSDVEELGAEISPFSGSPSGRCGDRNCTYGELVRDGRAAVYAFGDHNFLAEAVRAVLDNQTYARYTLSSERAQAVVRELNGTRFERLLAHSNGATVAEALIRANVIEVDEFNVIGGDRSLANGRALQELIDSGRVHRVRIWINPGDPIPAISSTLLSLPLRYEAQYWAGVATGQNRGGDARVEYCTLNGNVGQALSIGAHDLRAYMSNMRSGSCR